MGRSKKKKSRFSGKVNNSADRNTSGGSKFDYLNLPDGIEQFKPTPGDPANKLDFIPYIVTDKNHPEKNEESGTALKGEQWWRRSFRIHQKIGAGNGRSIVCPESWGAKCPICEQRRVLWEAKAPKEETTPLNSSLRYLYVVIPLKSEGNEDKKIHILNISDFAFQRFLKEETSQNEDYETFMDLEQGLTLRCRWSKEAFDEKSKPWAKIATIAFEERKKPYDEKILKKAPSLDNLFIKHSYDEIDKMFNEVEDVEEIDDTKKEKKDKKGKKDKKTPECPNGMTFSVAYDSKKKCKKCEFNKKCKKANEKE